MNHDIQTMTNIAEGKSLFSFVREKNTV